MKAVFRMKSILLLGFILVLSVGCSNQSNIENRLILNKIKIDEILFTEIERDIYKKTIQNKDELEKLASELQEIELANNPVKSPENIDDKDIFRINMIKKEENSRESITIIDGFAFYEGEWQPIKESSYNNISTLYYCFDSLEKEDELLRNVKIDRLARKELSLTKALEGRWLSEKGLEIKFIDNKLYQGNDFEYSFKYDIDESLEDSLKISIYAMGGIFTNGKNLANMDISFDETKSHIKIKKKMAGGMIYYDKLIHVDEKDNKLGNFDSLFFFKEENGEIQETFK